MCQSRAEGGRRCAAHHPGTLAMKNFIKKTYVDLEQGQVDYLFKSLRQEGRRRHTPTPEKYKEFLESLKQEVMDADYSESKKTQICARIDRAMQIEQMPDGASFYAYKKMNERAGEMYQEIRERVRAQSQATGKSPRQVMTQFKRAYSNVVSPRENIDYGQTLDPRSLTAWEHVTNATEPRFEETPRITRERTGRAVITSQGYDEEDGRLEVEIATGRGTGRVYAYRGVPRETYNRFLQSPGRVLNEIRGSHAYDYTNQAEADRDAYRVWCERCQRHHIASGHACEASNGRIAGQAVTPSYNVDEVYGRVVASIHGEQHTPRIPATPSWALSDEDRETVTLDDADHEREPGSQGSTPSNARRIKPKLDSLVQQLKEGKVVKFKTGRRIFVRGTGRREWNDVTTEVTAKAVNGNYEVVLSYNQNDVKCTCEVYQRNRDCTHIHPNRSYRVNRFVQQDINEVTAALTSYEDETLNIVSYPSSGSHIRLSQEGEISQEELDSILYEVNRQGTTGSQVTVRVPGDDDPITLSYRRNGALQVETSSSQRSTIGIADQIRNDTDISRAVSLRLRASLDDMLNEGWEVNQQSREEYLSRFRGNEQNGYLSNPDQFLQDWRAAEALRNEPTPFVEGSVTNGYLSSVQGEGRGFGIEIEVDGGRAAVNRIVQRLNAEGLAHQDSVAGYHQHNDFTHWRVENDCSVSGEIVSPILYDNEESWAQVRRVCEIARECGARATTNTGNHVHIGSQGLNRQARQGVLASVAANQDVVRRIATNPASGTHRTGGGSGYTAPFSERDITNAYRAHTSYYAGTLGQDRYRMANFGSGQHTIEFRDPDGSLDPGHIQANVMMSAALMSAGQHGRWSDLNAQTTHRQRVGANSIRETYINSAIENEDERIIASNISLMTTLDALFPDRESRRQIINVAVRNPWQSVHEPRW